MDPIPAQPQLDGSPAFLEDAPAPSGPPPAPVKVFVRDLADGARVESPFIVRDVTRRQKRNGDAFLKLQLGDVTGAVEAVVWDGGDAACEAAPMGSGGDGAGGLRRGSQDRAWSPERAPWGKGVALCGRP